MHTHALLWLFYALQHFAILSLSTWSVISVGGFLQKLQENTTRPLQRAVHHIEETGPPCWFWLPPPSNLNKSMNFTSTIIVTCPINYSWTGIDLIGDSRFFCLSEHGYRRWRMEEKLLVHCMCTVSVWKKWLPSNAQLQSKGWQFSTKEAQKELGESAQRKIIIKVILCK